MTINELIKALQDKAAEGLGDFIVIDNYEEREITNVLTGRVYGSVCYLEQGERPDNERFKAIEWEEWTEKGTVRCSKPS